MLFDTVLAFDHVKHRILLIANARISPSDDLESLYRLRQRAARLPPARTRAGARPAHCRQRPRHRSASRHAPSPLARTSSAIVRIAQDYIARGDIYQVVLSQRFEVDLRRPIRSRSTAPCAHVNPSPYMYFTRVGELSIVGSSPEMLVRVEVRPGRDAPDRRHASARPHARR